MVCHGFTMTYHAMSSVKLSRQWPNRKRLRFGLRRGRCLHEERPCQARASRPGHHAGIARAFRFSERLLCSVLCHGL